MTPLAEILTRTGWTLFYKMERRFVRWLYLVLLQIKDGLRFDSFPLRYLEENVGLDNFTGMDEWAFRDDGRPKCLCALPVGGVGEYLDGRCAQRLHRELVEGNDLACLRMADARGDAGLVVSDWYCDHRYAVDQRLECRVQPSVCDAERGVLQ